MGQATYTALVLSVVLFAFGCSSSQKNAETQDSKTAPTMDKAKDKVKKAAAAVTPESGQKLTCAHKSDERTIEVRAKDKGCETAYTKGGNETVVATSNSGSEHCEKVQSRISDNLKTAGFTCQ